MRYFKLSDGGYVKAFGVGLDGEEISAEEYAALNRIMAERPAADTGYAYRLRDDLTWELVELPSPAEEDISAEEALDIIMGVSK